jgi:type I restriction enzyme S subunit
LRIPNIANAKLDLRELKYASQALNLPNGEEVTLHDFLLVRTNGSRALIGRAAYVPVPLSEPHYYASYLIRFRLALDGKTAVVGRWLSQFWQAPDTRVLLEEKAATSAGQYNLSMSGLGSFAVPIAPEYELARLCEVIDDLHSVADAVNVSVVSKAAATSRLRQSILKWAFEGKLVDQDPNDEPASVLLARIRKERAASSESSPKRGRPRKAAEKSV